MQGRWSGNEAKGLTRRAERVYTHFKTPTQCLCMCITYRLPTAGRGAPPLLRAALRMQLAELLIVRTFTQLAVTWPLKR